MELGRKRKASDYVKLALEGLAFGTANKIPGVSGGTVAFIMGFYEEFIFSLKRFNKKALILLVNGRFRSLMTYTNAYFLLAIMAGTVTSFFTVSLALDWLLQYYPTQVWGSFFGMILASLYFLVVQYKAWSRKTVVALVFGTLVGYSITLISHGDGGQSLTAAFFSGIISVCGMTLPGLSGSFILMLIGNYKLLLVDSVNAIFYFLRGVVTFDLEPVLGDPETVYLLKVGILFTIGSMIGVVSLSHILGYFLKRWRDIVIALIIGFITGSMIIMWPWKTDIYLLDTAGQIVTDNGRKVISGYENYLPDLAQGSTWSAIALTVFGAALIVAIELYNKGRKNKKAIKNEGA